MRRENLQRPTYHTLFTLLYLSLRGQLLGTAEKLIKMLTSYYLPVAMSFSDHDDLAALSHILAHLFKAVKAEEGVNLSRLQGILSQLPRSVLGPYSANQDTIRLIAKQFPNRIVVAQDKVYTLAGLGEKRFRQKSCEPAGKQQQLASGDPPAELHNVAGSVSKLLMLYGFVDLEPPHRVSVFFDKRLFDGNRHSDLTKCWLKVGDRVLIDAVRSPPGHRAKYQATRIQAAKKMEENPAPSRMPSETDGGVIYGCPGTIQAVNPSHGFIVFGQDNKQCASFFINHVDGSLLKPGKNLDDILKAGSKVQFDAQPNPKPSTIAKWLATNVKKAPCAQSGRASDSGDEAFLSDSEIAELLIETKEFSARRKLSGIRGAFYPNSKNTGLVAAFDQNIIVRVVVDVAYCGGKKLRSFGELLKDCSLQDEVEVFVDAVEAERDKWVATLMWTGDRPPHPLVDQSECAFRSALSLALAEMPAVPCKDIGNVDAPTKFCAKVEHNVAVYPNSKGILKVVDDNRAVCEVQEPEGCRNVEFVTFYKNRVPRMGQFKSVLQEGDVVHIDYMVGTVGGKDEVCCRVVWQGDRPVCDRLTSPTEFGLILKGRASAERLADITGGLQGRPSRLVQAPVLTKDPGAPKWPSATGIATMTAKATGGHPSADEPKVYNFVSLKGTVVEVCESAAIVEVREGASVRELTITVDNFYNEGRPYLNNLTRVLRKGSMINVDYMVGRVGGEDLVHCDVAWLGPKPKGAACLTEEEFRQQLSGRGSCNTFINDLQSTTLELNNLFKDTQRGPAKQSLPLVDHQQTEVYQPPPQPSSQAAGTRPQNELYQPLQQSSEAVGRPQTEVYRQLPPLSQVAGARPKTELNQPLPQTVPRVVTSAQKEMHPLPWQPQATDTRSQMEAYQPSTQSLSQAVDTYRQMQAAPKEPPQSHSQAAKVCSPMEVHPQAAESSQANIYQQMKMHQPPLQSLSHNIRTQTEVYRQPSQLLLKTVDTDPQTDVHWQPSQPSQAVGNHHKSMEVYSQSPQVNIRQQDVCQPPTRSHSCIGTHSQTEAYQQAPQVMSQVNICSQKEVNQAAAQSLSLVNIHPQTEGYQPLPQSGSQVTDINTQMEPYRQPSQAASQANICPQKDVNQTPTLLPSRASIHVQPEAHWPLPQSVSLANNSNLQIEAYREALRAVSQTAHTSSQMEVKVAPSRTSEPHSADSRHLPELTSSDSNTRRGSFNFSEEMYNCIVKMVREQSLALIRSEIKDVLQDSLKWQEQKVSENAPTSQGQGDGGTAVGPTEWQPCSVSCPNVPQKPDVAAGSSLPSETSLDAAVRKREVKPPPGFYIPPSSALVERKPEPVTVASAWQTSNILQQPSTSWCTSTSQFGGHPQASSNINATSVLPEESPAAAIHSSWQPSNVSQQPGVATPSTPAQVLQQTWCTATGQLGGGQPSSFEMRQNVSVFQGHGGSQQDVQDSGISFDDSLAEGDELSEDDLRQLGLLGT